MKILIVDDNVDAAFLLSMLLKSQGHDVHATNGALEALDLARTSLDAAASASDATHVLPISADGLAAKSACAGRFLGSKLVRKSHAVRHLPATCGNPQQLLFWHQCKSTQLGF